MKECDCGIEPGAPGFPRPRPEPKPNKPDACVRCGGHLSAEWTSNDSTLKAFLDSLREGMPTADSGAWEAFRRHVEDREFAGRDVFGLEFLRRENIEEALGAATSLALYPYLDSLKVRRETGKDDDEMAVVLTAAQKAFDAYMTLLVLREKRKGAP